MKDPCEQPIGDTPSGDVACRVADGNQCIPDLISSSYSCKCLPSFRRFEYKKGSMAGKDNCAEQISACLATKCHHGKCIAASFIYFGFAIIFLRLQHKQHKD